MECISVFDMLKIGVGPSSSHTLGPWRAAERWINELNQHELLQQIDQVRVYLYGSLSLTGKGHATDTAIIMGLLGEDPETTDCDAIEDKIQRIKSQNTLLIAGQKEIPFVVDEAIVFKKEFLPFHANALTFEAFLDTGSTHRETYYSIGGGFVIKEERTNSKKNKSVFNSFPHPIQTGEELLAHCKQKGKNISEIVWENELSLRTEAEINSSLNRIWETMLECMYLGCHTQGTLPGGLSVKRRAYENAPKAER